MTEECDEVKVSVVCNAYNHGLYIRKTLEGFVNQKTSFRYEVLIHDDASTDDTAKIIKEYELKYPDVIKPIYQVENQYSKNLSIGRTFQYPRAKGKYIAFCEGDDFWVDDLKLQKQYDALESHPEIDICATGADIIFQEQIVGSIAPSDKDCIFSPLEVIKGGGNFVASASLFFRKELNDNMPQFRAFYNLDYTLQIHGSLKGGMYYIASKSAVYRRFATNSWTFQMLRNPQEFLKHEKLVEQMLIYLNEDTQYRYRDEVDGIILKNQFRQHELKGDYGVLRSEKFKGLYKKISLKKRLKIFLGYHCPVVFKVIARFFPKWI